MTKFQLRSPRNGYVASILVKDGTQVIAGASLVSLDSKDEDRALERIALAQALLALQVASISGDQVEARREILKSTVEIADAHVNYAYKNASYQDLSYKQGLTDGPHTWQATAANARATAEQERANISSQLFEVNLAQVKTKLELLTKAISKEQEEMTIRKARLTIQSPVPGKVKLHGWAGMFVMKGDVLAEVDT